MFISVVCPCYNERPCVRAFVEQVSLFLTDLPYEIIFVDDGSTDGTLNELKRMHSENPAVGYVSFSRNFGKEAALMAGLRRSRGDVVVTMDADLQDPPSLLPEMIHGLEEGYDCVATRRCTRKGEPLIRSWLARCFYGVMRRLSDVELVDGARDYRLMRRRVVEAILSMPENNRFTKGIYQWVGFQTKWISFENVERREGETKWSLLRLFVYACDGILAFSTAPLMFASWLGLCCCSGAFLYVAWVWTRVMLYGDPVAGWPSLVCIIVFIGGLQLLVIGILGAYLSKVYSEVKRRPLYFVAEEA